MEYYKIYSADGATLIGVASSADFRYFTKDGVLLVCDESKAQYVYVNNKLYHADDLFPEPEEQKGKFENVIIKSSTLKEISEYKKQKTEEIQKILQMTIKNSN